MKLKTPRIQIILSTPMLLSLLTNPVVGQSGSKTDPPSDKNLGLRLEQIFDLPQVSSQSQNPESSGSASIPLHLFTPLPELVNHDLMKFSPYSPIDISLYRANSQEMADPLQDRKIAAALNTIDRSKLQTLGIGENRRKISDDSYSPREIPATTGSGFDQDKATIVVENEFETLATRLIFEKLEMEHTLSPGLSEVLLLKSGTHEFKLEIWDPENSEEVLVLENPALSMDKGKGYSFEFDERLEMEWGQKLRRSGSSKRN